MIEKEILSWLVYVPATDINFKNKLKEANMETLREAINTVNKRDLQMTKLKRLRAEYKRRKRNLKHGDHLLESSLNKIKDPSKRSKARKLAIELETELRKL